MRKMLFAAVILLLFQPVLAVQQEPFTGQRFAELQQQNARILVDVFADWCPTCARQQAVLKLYAERFPQSDLVILTVDFDRQKEWVKHFRVPRQSTLILYQGDKQLWFSVAEVRPDVIFAALNQTVKE